MYPQQRARDRRRLGLLIALWVLLAAVTIAWGIPHIQAHLRGEAEQALGAAEFGDVEVRFSGRDATLTGSVQTEDDIITAVEVVEALWGVRTARHELAVERQEQEATPATTATTVAAEPVSPSLSVTPGASSVVLEGTVGSQVTAAALNATAAAAFARPVDDRLDVDPQVGEPPWTADIATLLRGVGAIGGTLVIEEGVLTVSGLVPDEGTRTTILSDLAALDPDLQVIDGLELDPIAGEAVFAIDSQPARVTLRGTVDSSERVETLVETGEQIYGTGNVVSALTLDETATVPSWVEDATALFQALEGRKLDLIATADAVYLRGVVPTETTSASIAATVTDLVGPLPVVNELTVVEADPETVAAVEAINELIGTSLTFASGSPELTADATERLDQVAAILSDRPELRGVVEGHTDDIGTAADNLALSEARARSVVAYLVSAGIDPDRLTSIGYGESRPIASNTTEEGRATNRRIEFQVEGSI